MSLKAVIPDWRWRALVNAADTVCKPSDVYLARVYDVILDIITDDDISDALDLVRVAEHRETLIAFFLCGATVDQISQCLEISTTVLEHVRMLVMDMTQFRNKLEKLSYARSLVDSGNMTDKGREYLETGLTHGPDALFYHFVWGNEEMPIDARRHIRQFIQTAYHLSTTARGNKVTAESTKEAIKWIGMATKLHDTLKEMDETHAGTGKDAYAEIEKRKVTLSIDELGEPVYPN
jgi:hypothetical protein